MWLLCLALALAAEPDADARAKAVFTEGRAAYGEGNYAFALARFLEAHALSGRDALLYNVALAAERLGDYDLAIDALQRFLPTADAATAAVVRERLAALEDLRDRYGNVSSRPSPDVPAPTPAPQAPDATTPPPAPVESTPPVTRRPARVSGGLIVAATMSEVYRAFRQVERNLLPEIEDPGQLRRVSNFLVPLAQHLDYNVIGRGESVRLDTDVLLAFTVDRLHAGADLDAVSRELVAEYRAGRLSDPAGRPNADQLSTHVGGYLVTEFEFHQEPDGTFVPLAELNQARVYFAASLNPFADAGRFSTLIEWNPVPEEVIHQIDEITLDSGAALAPITRDIEGLVPFEQAYLQVSEIAGAPVSVTLGQIRLPFGLWSDYSSHRNFTTTKNNLLVHGFALKKIELGGLASASAGPATLDLAAVHGRLGRTSPLDRADFDRDLDLSVRVRVESDLAQASASAYLVAADPTDGAYGASLAVTPGRVSLSGEFVYQTNPNADDLYGAGVTRLDSVAGYAQFEWMLLPRWRLYGLYDVWQLRADGEAHLAPAGKIFHGVRYLPHQQVRWTIVEFGSMLHQGYDEGFAHASTQMEVVF